MATLTVMSVRQTCRSGRLHRLLVAVLLLVSVNGQWNATVGAADLSQIHYLALGDSVASGQGLGNTSGDCRLSQQGYPYLVASQLARRWEQDIPVQMLACSGATARHNDTPAKDFQSQTNDAITQIEGIPSSEPILVTITIGADDLSLLTYDSLNILFNANISDDEAFDYIEDKIAPVSDIMYTTVKDLLAFPNVHVVATLYPNPFPPIGRFARIQYAVERINQVVILDTYLAMGLPSRMLYTPTALIDNFSHHTCYDGSPSWYQGFVDPNSDAWAPWLGDCFHPNALGVVAITDSVVGQANRLLEEYEAGAGSPPIQQIPGSEPLGVPEPPYTQGEIGSEVCEIQPRLTTSLSISPSTLDGGGTITGSFSITNAGCLPFEPSVVTISGRGPGNTVHDFPFVSDISLGENASYTYQAELGLTTAGDYAFTPAYQDTNGNWFTFSPAAGIETRREVSVSDVSMPPVPNQDPVDPVLDDGNDGDEYTGFDLDRYCRQRYEATGVDWWSYPDTDSSTHEWYCIDNMGGIELIDFDDVAYQQYGDGFCGFLRDDGGWEARPCT